MECEICRGKGRVYTHDFTRWPIQLQGFTPCPGCHGTGQQSCCAGMVGGPDDTTNGPVWENPVGVCLIYSVEDVRKIRQQCEAEHGVGCGFPDCKCK